MCTERVNKYIVRYPKTFSKIAAFTYMNVDWCFIWINIITACQFSFTCILYKENQCITLGVIPDQKSYARRPAPQTFIKSNF